MKCSLTNLGKGVAIEKFNHELATVIANIVDPNTDYKVKRQIDLTIKMTPTEDRSSCHVEIQSKSKLAPTKATESIMYVGIDNRTGEVHAEEFNPEQQDMFQGKTGKVAHINGGN